MYRDEPIPEAATWSANPFPSRYRDMRRIAQGVGITFESDPRIFYEQGKFMEDFEDDFEYRGDFMRYYPTYQCMSDLQLRGYFSWRTKIRKGIIEKTSLSFAFVHIYELLNRIGVRTAEDGFHRLKNLWTAYRVIDDRIDRYLRQWLKDYVVYNNLDRSLLADVSDTESDEAVLTLLNYRSFGEDDVFAAMNSLSPYKIECSWFYKQHPDDVKRIVYAVFAALSEFYEKKRKNGVCERFFGKIHTSSYFMFRSAVFHPRPNRTGFVYEVNDICKYRFENEKWVCERIFCYKNKIREIGELLKTVDYLMRKEYDFKPVLKIDKPVKTLQAVIAREIEKLRIEQRQNARPRIDIDLSKLHGIRETALETQNRLIVEEPDVTENPEEKFKPKNKTNLNDAETELLQCLLEEKPYAVLFRSKGVLPSLLVDSVNEKLFDRFNDTVIGFDGDEPKIIDDYRNALKGIIEK